jgi:polar amino acid transport system substrate-binding protein
MRLRAAREDHRGSACSLPALLVLFSIGVPALGQPAKAVVGVAPFPPHVMESPGASEGLEGFDIELWREVARLAGVDYQYKLYSLADLLDALRAGDVDVALAGLTITENREEEFDFSYPYLHTGLAILVRPTREASLLRLLRSATSSTVLTALASLAAFIAICAHVLYFVERRGGAMNRSYIPGIFEAAWCILTTMTTVGYGDIAPRRWIGRLVASLVMIIGIALFGLIVADLSSGLTLQQLTSDIESPEDLAGKTVATVEGSTSVRALERYGAEVREVPTVEQAYGLLRAGAVDAVVFDASPLMKRAADAPSQFAVVGGIFDTQNYGIGLRRDSPLRERINLAILRLQENGTYGEIYRRWFGADPQ